jgi:hypothetical protein
LCGLIARQQAILWKSWRPWLALLGIASLIGIRLNFIAGGLTAGPLIYIRTYLKYGVIYQSGLSLTEELVVWLSMAVAVMLWSWSSGFVFVALARNAAVGGSTLVCIAWLCWNVLAMRLVIRFSPWSLFLLLIPWFLFFVPAAWGARRAVRDGELPLQQAIALFAATVGVIAFVTWTSGWQQAGLARWSEGAIHGGMPWYRRLLPYLLLSWPAAWILASSCRQSGVMQARRAFLESH